MRGAMQAVVQPEMQEAWQGPGARERTAQEPEVKTEQERAVQEWTGPMGTAAQTEERGAAARIRTEPAGSRRAVQAMVQEIEETETQEQA